MDAARGTNSLIHLNLNENAFGASSKVAPAITRELPRLSHFADDKLASELKEQIATYEQVDTEQIVLGETLSALGLYLGGKGGHAASLFIPLPVTWHLSMPPLTSVAWYLRPIECAS
jgi:histidinol-phosphate aminotransferase